MDTKDRALHKGLMRLMDSVTFPLMAKEITAFARIYEWTKSLPDQFIAKPVSAFSPIRQENEAVPTKKKTKKKAK